MRFDITKASVILSFGLLGACEASAPTQPAAVADGLATDRSVYQAEIQVNDGGWTFYSFTLIASISNPLDSTLKIERCGPESPQPMWFFSAVDGASGEKPAYNLGWACVGHDSPILVAPGRTRIDTIRVTGPTGFDAQNRPIGQLEGRFRLVYLVSVCENGDTCVPVPESLGASNSFEVVIPR